MKNSILRSFILIALFCAASAQAKEPAFPLGPIKVVPKFTLGIKVGANMQQISGNLSDNKFNGGVLGGIFLGVTKKKIGVQLEGLVKSAKIEYKPTPTSLTNATIKTVSLDVPVLFEYKLFWRLWLQVGPQFTTMISAKQSSTDVMKQFNTTDFAGVAGLQVTLPARLTFDARYILGVTNINKESVSGVTGAWNNRCIQVALGFRFL